MFGNEIVEKLFDQMSQTTRMITEVLSKTVESVRILDERARSSEANINVVAEFTKKNAPTITSVPWEVSNLNVGYERLLGIIERQDAKIGRLEETIAKSISANFKANEETKNNLNSLIEIVKNSHEFTNRQSQIHSEFYRSVADDYPKTKTVIEYLLLSSSDSGSKKPVKS